MCGAFAKPQGTVAKVHTAQVTLSIRTKLQNKDHETEAPQRVPWPPEDPHLKEAGFTRVNAGEFEDTVAEKWLIPNGCGVKYIPSPWSPGQVSGPEFLMFHMFSCTPANHAGDKPHIQSGKKNVHTPQVCIEVCIEVCTVITVVTTKYVINYPISEVSPSEC